MSDEKTSAGPWQPREWPAGGALKKWRDPMGTSSNAAATDGDEAINLLRELEFAAGDDWPYCYCALCGAKPTDSPHYQPGDEKHGEERDGTPCRLGAMLDKHGRG